MSTHRTTATVDTDTALIILGVALHLTFVGAAARVDEYATMPELVAALAALYTSPHWKDAQGQAHANLNAGGYALWAGAADGSITLAHPELRLAIRFDPADPAGAAWLRVPTKTDSYRFDDLRPRAGVFHPIRRAAA